MNTLLQTNIFFIITSVSVILLALFSLIILLILILVLLDIRKFTNKSRKEGEEILEDVHILREEAKRKKTEIMRFLVFLKRKIKHYLPRRVVDLYDEFEDKN